MEEVQLRSTERKSDNVIQEPSREPNVGYHTRHAASSANVCDNAIM